MTARVSSAKRAKMLAFWSERAAKHGSAPEANTNDIWLRELEISYLDSLIKDLKPEDVLDFGCANGYSTLRLAETNPGCNFVGVDINAEMIQTARQSLAGRGLPNAVFDQQDILEEPLTSQFDLIIAVRVFQNIESHEAQRAVFDRLVDQLKPQGAISLIESYADEYQELNEHRSRLALPRLPIHSHLTLLTKEFDQHVESRLEVISRDFIASSYYLVTRLVYSKLAMINGEAIDYDHPLHRIAAEIPQIGEYGPLKATLCRKGG